jgi:NAD(P)-dependent dehydrogenase (short-subunit alcohol dehydrogenase family)
MAVKSILITGSNRGLGLEWATQYARAGWKVFATCRFPEQASHLKSLQMLYDNVSVHTLDVTQSGQLAQLKQSLAGSPIDLLINNAGVYHEQWAKDALGKINYEQWAYSFEVNSIGAMRVSEALMDNILKSETRLIVAITSHMGSIHDISNPRDYAYRSSKAALNAAMKGLSLEVVKQKVGILILHPGWVRTRMGGDSAPLTTEQSVIDMRELIKKFTMRQTGHFYRYDGTRIPW